MEDYDFMGSLLIDKLEHKSRNLKCGKGEKNKWLVVEINENL